MLFVIASITGCTISSDKPVFGPEDSVKIDGVDGLYFLYLPLEKDIADHLLASVKNGEIELIDLDDCKEKRKCTWKPIVVRLPSSKNSNVVQITEQDREDTVYVFVDWVDALGRACVSIDEDKYGPYIDQIQNIASIYDFETESFETKDWKYNRPVVITDNAEPEAVLSFLDEVWFKIPHDVWNCFGLIPEDKPVKAYLDAFSKEVSGKTLIE